MFITSPDQDYIMLILRKTRFMRTSQAIRLLNCLDADKAKPYTMRALSQLKHMGKIIWKTEDVFALPQLYNAPVDCEMLSAADIMLNLTEFRILALSADKPPFKLCFFTGQENSLGSYGVVVVPPGSEAGLSSALFDAEKRTVIFLLTDLSQKDSLKTSLPHFFAVHDGNRYRYFKGGE